MRHHQPLQSRAGGRQTLRRMPTGLPLDQRRKAILKRQDAIPRHRHPPPQIAARQIDGGPCLGVPCYGGVKIVDRTDPVRQARRTGKAIQIEPARICRRGRVRVHRDHLQIKPVLQPQKQVMRAEMRMPPAGLQRQSQPILHDGASGLKRLCRHRQMIEPHGVSPFLLGRNTPGVVIVAPLVRATMATGTGPRWSRCAGAGPRPDQPRAARMSFRISCAASGMLVPGPKIAFTPAFLRNS